MEYLIGAAVSVGIIILMAIAVRLIVGKEEYYDR